jgi:hypothetical protein
MSTAQCRCAAASLGQPRYLAIGEALRIAACDLLAEVGHDVTAAAWDLRGHDQQRGGGNSNAAIRRSSGSAGGGRVRWTFSGRHPSVAHAGWTVLAWASRANAPARI